MICKRNMIDYISELANINSILICAHTEGGPSRPELPPSFPHISPLYLSLKETEIKTEIKYRITFST